MKTIYCMALTAVVAAMLATGMPVRANETDSRIESSAKQSHVFKTYLKNDDIKIESKDGVVVLTGIVADESHKLLAQETLSSLPGVKSVDNKLEIKGAPSTATADSWLTTKVKTTLLFHRSVSAKTEVATKNGIVTLKGDADNQAQKDLTSEYVRDVYGVKDVKNEMNVTNAPKSTLAAVVENIDDASITAQVKLTLLYHRSTSSLNTSVKTENGFVTLTGKAGSAAEKDLAAKLAKDVNGVKDVNNQMNII